MEGEGSREGFKAFEVRSRRGKCSERADAGRGGGDGGYELEKGEDVGGEGGVRGNRAYGHKLEHFRSKSLQSQTEEGRKFCFRKLVS